MKFRKVFDFSANSANVCALFSEAFMSIQRTESFVRLFSFNLLPSELHHEGLWILANLDSVSFFQVPLSFFLIADEAEFAILVQDTTIVILDSAELIRSLLLLHPFSCLVVFLSMSATDFALFVAGVHE